MHMGGCLRLFQEAGTDPYNLIWTVPLTVQDTTVSLAPASNL